MIEIAPDAAVGEVVKRHPSVGPILLQRGRLFRVRPGSLYPEYSPPITFSEFAATNGVDLEKLLALVRRAAEGDLPSAVVGHDPPGYELPEKRALSGGPLGYTGAYREPGQAEANAMPMTAALARRGPD